MNKNKSKPTKNKFENNWLFKNLEHLEKDCWKAPEYYSHLITTCHQLRKKPLNTFVVEDLRIMISQNIGLKYLIPLAIEALKKNILAEGDLYQGDLLSAVLKSDKQYWKYELDNWSTVCELFEQNKNLLENCQINEGIKDAWFRSFTELRKLQ